MTYTATLFDAHGLTSEDKRVAEEAFCQRLDDLLGGAEGVATAWSAYDAAFQAHGETPLPPSASNDERAAVARWEGAERAATMFAFDGWHNLSTGAHFEVSANA